MTRRLCVISVALALSACKFTTDRQLNSGEIRGQVVFDTATGAPAANARIILENSALAVTADGSGRFVLPNLPAGTYTLDVLAARTGNLFTSGVRLAAVPLNPTTTGLGDGTDLGQVVIGDFGSISSTITDGTAAVSAAKVVLTGVNLADSSQVPSPVGEGVIDGGPVVFQRVVPGDYQVTVYSNAEPGGPVVSTPQGVSVTAGQAESVSVDLSTAAMVSTTTITGGISGTAQFAGAGGAGMNDGIDIILASPDVDPMVLADINMSIGATMSSGSYSIPQVPPGVYSMTFSSGSQVTVEVDSVLVGSGTTNVPMVTLSSLNSLADGGPISDSSRVAAACGAFDDCGASPFPDGGPTCSQVIGGALTDLENASCSASVVDLDSVADCLGRSTCVELQGDGAACPALIAALHAPTDPNCQQIVTMAFGEGPTDAGSMDAGSVDAGNPPDSGTVDAGGATDAGSVVDAGGMDAGSVVDAGDGG